jgi:hypothetical protein
LAVEHLLLVCTRVQGWMSHWGCGKVAGVLKRFFFSAECEAVQGLVNVNMERRSTAFSRSTMVAEWTTVGGLR